MTIRQTACRALAAPDLRRRIVALAVQEWAFFGFPVLDRLAADEPDSQPPGPRRRRRLDPAEAARVAHSIAGYWTATPGARWVLDRQNEAWSGPEGVAERWQAPWSAAFISWLMCEAGLGDSGSFQRAVAHHVYIDQAIRARGAANARAAYVAHDPGEAPVEPGDLLCSARRPPYRSLADRRRQMGEGARTHCDVVVRLDASGGRILAIGGNVRGLVSLKLLPAAPARAPGRSGPAPWFAHLKLRAPSIEPDAFERTPTMEALACATGFRVPSHLTAANFAIPLASSCAG